MKPFRTLFAGVIILLSCHSMQAQQFLWEAGLDYRFDNREYSSVPHAESRTIFGTHLVPQIGIGWGEGNAMMLGVDVTADFGHKAFNTPLGLLLYYKYADSRHNVYAGVFPRKSMMGDYSTAFFSDSVRFCDTNLDGMLLQYYGKRGYIELGCDWNSMYSFEHREKFMLFSAGRIDAWALYAGYNMMMYHHAGSVTQKGVVDNVLLYPYLGVDLSGRAGFRRLYIQAGWLQALQNDRRYVGQPVSAAGWQVEARMERWGFGIYNTFYVGKNLMPYYDSVVDGQPEYGAGLYFGDTFYRVPYGKYNRLELYWEPLSKDDLKLRISSIHHYDGRNWGWQQMLSIVVAIGNRTFKPKVKPGMREI